MKTQPAPKTIRPVAPHITAAKPYPDCEAAEIPELQSHLASLASEVSGLWDTVSRLLARLEPVTKPDPRRGPRDEEQKPLLPYCDLTIGVDDIRGKVREIERLLIERTDSLAI